MNEHALGAHEKTCQYKNVLLVMGKNAVQECKINVEYKNVQEYKC